MEVHVDYTMTAVKMLLESIVPQSPTKPFRFVYTSGGLVPYLDSNVLFFLGEGRKARVCRAFSATMHSIILIDRRV